MSVELMCDMLFLAKYLINQGSSIAIIAYTYKCIVHEQSSSHICRGFVVEFWTTFIIVNVEIIYDFGVEYCSSRDTSHIADLHPKFNFSKCKTFRDLKMSLKIQKVREGGTRQFWKNSSSIQSLEIFSSMSLLKNFFLIFQNHKIFRGFSILVQFNHSSHTFWRTLTCTFSQNGSLESWNWIIMSEIYFYKCSEFMENLLLVKRGESLRKFLSLCKKYWNLNFQLENQTKIAKSIVEWNLKCMLTAARPHEKVKTRIKINFYSIFHLCRLDSLKIHTISNRR